MRIVNEEHVFPPDFVHCHQVANRCLKSAEGLVMIEVANVLADECLTLDDQSDAVL